MTELSQHSIDPQDSLLFSAEPNQIA